MAMRNFEEQYRDTNEDAGTLSEAIWGLTKKLSRDLAPGILVFVAGRDPNKGYNMLEALGPTIKFINIGNFLSRELVESTRAGRSLKVLKLLGDQAAHGPVCFYDIEILFDSEMDLNVVSILKTISKGREIFVDWPGEWDVSRNEITFAKVGDPAYRAFAVESAFGVVDLSGRASPSLEF